MLASLSPLVGDQSKTVHTFAKELDEKTKSQFAYLLDPKSNQFQSIFWVAAYLSPVYRVLLTSDTEKMKEVKKFLKSKSVICLAFIIIIVDYF